MTILRLGVFLVFSFPVTRVAAQVSVDHSPVVLTPAVETEVSISLQADPGLAFDLGGVIFNFEPNHLELVDFRWESGLDAGSWFSDTSLPGPGAVFGGGSGGGPIVSDSVPFLVATVTLRSIGCEAVLLDTIPLTVTNSTDFAKLFVSSGLPMSFQSLPNMPTPLQIGVDGPRHITLSFTAQDLPVAIRVTSPDQTCLDRFVDIDGKLSDIAVYQLDTDWNGVAVSGTDIAPDTTYTLSTFCAATVTPAVSITTPIYGDTDDDGDVDVFDVTCVFSAFQSESGGCSVTTADLAPADPDGMVNIFDISAVLDAFDGLPYPWPLSCP